MDSTNKWPIPRVERGPKTLGAIEIKPEEVAAIRSGVDVAVMKSLFASMKVGDSIGLDVNGKDEGDKATIVFMSEQEVNGAKLVVLRQKTE